MIFFKVESWGIREFVIIKSHRNAGAGIALVTSLVYPTLSKAATPIRKSDLKFNVVRVIDISPLPTFL